MQNKPQVERRPFAPKRWEEEVDSSEEQSQKKPQSPQQDYQPRKNREVVDTIIPTQVLQREKRHTQSPQVEITAKKQAQQSKFEKYQYKRENRQQEHYNRNQNKTKPLLRTQSEEEQSQNYQVETRYAQSRQFANIIIIEDQPNHVYEVRALALIQKHPFIILKAVGRRITKAFLLAEKICKIIKDLDRINIPSTTEVEEIWHPNRTGLEKKVKFVRSAEVNIELSRGKLQSRHMGHQTYKNKDRMNEDYNRGEHKRKTYRQIVKQ